MAKLTAHGITLDPPAGWDGQIYLREPQPLGAMAATYGASPETPMPIAHLANFALPAQRGDYGGGAIESMRPGGVFISILQHDPSEVTAALFKGRKIPWPLAADSFDLNAMPRRMGNHAAVQSFFIAGGRPYCVYVVIGSHTQRAILAPVVNQALATVSFT